VQVLGFKKEVKEEMQAFISGDRCMRVVMDQVIDRRVD
jgi:hypothetical protein